MAKYNPDIHHIHRIIKITTVGADSISALSISGKNDTEAGRNGFCYRAEMDSATGQKWILPLLIVFTDIKLITYKICS